MLTVDNQISAYVEAFGHRHKQVSAQDRWCDSLQEAAMDRFVELGFPSAADEDWRDTRLEHITNTAFCLAESDASNCSAATVASHGFPELESTVLVFVDGRWNPELSSTTHVPRGVYIGSLAIAIDTNREQVEPHFAQYANGQQDSFTALNTAFADDGLFVCVPNNTVVDRPIHAIYISSASGDEPVMTHPRNLIVVGQSSDVTVIEDYVSLGDRKHFTNTVTELVIAENARAGHYRLCRENPNAISVTTLRTRQLQDSSLVSHSVMTGGQWIRNNLHNEFTGPNGTSLLNGLYVNRRSQHVDNHMVVEHAAPHCSSRQVYTGILDDQASAVFGGRIMVAKDAQKTDAKQSNRNLLLSEAAQVNAKPQLEIYADDVKCTHGATVGQINEEAVYYFRTRGLSEPAARALAVYAFASESLGRMDLDSIRANLSRAILAQLPHGDLIEKVV